MCFLEEMCSGKTEEFDREWLGGGWVDAGSSEIQSLTVRQIVPLATRCPFNFSACWLIAKEHCLSQRESNLAYLPGYSSAKAPYNEPVLLAPSSKLLWCSYLLSFSWLAIQRCTNTHPLRRPSAWKLEQYAHGKWEKKERKWDSTVATNENHRGIVTHFNVMR